MSNLFFDLDGTLLNVKVRNLAVYHTVITDLRIPAVPDDEYWEQKQNHTLPFIPKQKEEEFRIRFKTESETSEMLRLDTVVPGIFPLLTECKKRHKLYIVTNRHNSQNLHIQLKQLDLLSFFGAIITPYPNLKAIAITQQGYTSNDIVIGDTEEDITTARQLNITSIAVPWGLRKKEYLASYTPTYLVSSVEELQHLLLNFKHSDGGV